MDIAEMHIAFRQYAQQMGMQNVRAILPEQIDILINQSIMDNVNQLIRDNISVTNDRVITDNSKIAQVNAFRTLHDVVEIEITVGPETAENAKFTYNPKNRLLGLIKYLGNRDAAYFPKYMFLTDISINYTSGANTELITSWYPVRIIDSAYLADSLNDFILKNRFRSPIACIYTNNLIELYIDKFKQQEAGVIDPVIEIQSGTTAIPLRPHALRLDIIKYPRHVKYVEDISEGVSVDCDLPESMHGDIVKHAVDLYRVALNGSLQGQQEAEQAQQRENIRNNYRNEGN